MSRAARAAATRAAATVTQLAGVGRRGAALLAAAALAGCGAEAAADRDGVVAFDPFGAETLVALGERPEAVPQLASPPESLDGLPTIALDHSAGPDVERLAQLAPELVVSSPTWAAFHPAVERLGAEVRSVDVRSLDGLRRATLDLGAAVGREREARELAAGYRRAARRARRGVPGTRPEVLLVFGTIEGALAFLPDTYAADLVRRLGGTVASRGLPESRRFEGFAPLSMEEVVRRDPDVIVAVTHGAAGSSDQAAARLREQPAWRDLTAVRSGRVHVTGAELLLTSPGPRVGEALRRLRRFMYG